MKTRNHAVKKSTGYLFLLIFAGVMAIVMALGQASINNTPPVRIDRAVTIEQPKKMEKIVYKFKPVSLELKLLIY